MGKIKYYAKFSHCCDETGNNICVHFPDVSHACTFGETMSEAIERAKEVLLSEIELDESLIPDVFPPSTLEELETEAGGVLKEYEIKYEFVPITVTIDNNSYLRCVKPQRRLN